MKRNNNDTFPTIEAYIDIIPKSLFNIKLTDK